MSSESIKRRSFLGKSLLATGSLLMGANAKANAQNTHSTKALPYSFDPSIHLFAAESGQIGVDKNLGIGFVQVGDVTRFEAKVKSLREELDHRSRLTYVSNNRYKLPFAKAMIDLAVDSNDITFDMFLFSGEVENPNRRSKDAASNYQVLVRKKEIYQEAFSDVSANGKTVAVKYQSPGGPSLQFSTDIYDRTGMQYQAVDTRLSSALQLADFLTGSFLAAYDGRRLNPVKQELIGYLAAKLGHPLKPGLATAQMRFHKK